jgi:hypothetical protein
MRASQRDPRGSSGSLGGLAWRAGEPPQAGRTDPLRLAS